MKILSIVNQKGGVGKSTLAVNLAIAAIKDKKRTLLIDADTQGSSIAFRAIREQDDLQAIAITTPTIHKDIKKFKESYDFVIIDAGGRNICVPQVVAHSLEIHVVALVSARRMSHPVG